MPTTIYYFTGTGNSLHVARKIAEQLGESKIINIARARGDVIDDKSEIVGIVYPVYYRNPPNIVKDFVKKLRLDPKAYVFGIATCGGSAGNSISMLDKLLSGNGSRLSAAFELVMADNAYLFVNLVTPPAERDELYNSSEEGLNNIIDVLRKREGGREKIKSDISGDIMGGIGSALITDVYRLRKRFRSTDKCNGCGICEKICPVGNITRADKKVSWGNKCTQCLACFHWCPQTAIEIGNKSASIARYHHPDIKLSDMIK